MMKFLFFTLLGLSASVFCKIDLNKKSLKELTGEHLLDPEYEFDSMDIYSISADAFTDASKTIQILDLSHNKFTSLPATVFQDMRKIQKINLGSNKLGMINKNLFSGLRSLEEIKLKSCSLTQVEPGTFDGLKKLHTLDLSSNYIKSLENSLFKDLTELIELELQYNLLEDFPAELYSKTKNLKEISLDNNQLTKLDVDPLNKLCLERLTLSNNKGSFDVRMSKKSLFSSKICAVVSNVAGGAVKSSSKVDLVESNSDKSASGILAGSDFDLDCTCSLKLH